MELVNIVTKETIDLKERVEGLRDQLDLLMQKLMSDERKWETIMMMQVVVVRVHCLIEKFAYYSTKFQPLLISFDLFRPQSLKPHD